MGADLRGMRYKRVLGELEVSASALRCRRDAAALQLQRVANTDSSRRKRGLSAPITRCDRPARADDLRDRPGRDVR